MAELRRLGDAINIDADINIEDQRIVQGLDNLGIKILFSDETFGVNEFYEFSTPTKAVKFPRACMQNQKRGKWKRS